MSKVIRSFCGYFGLLALLIGFDQVTKAWAIKNLLDAPRHIFSGFNLILAFNRGVSFGWLSFESSKGFALLIGFIVLVIAGLIWYTYRAYKNGVFIFPEICILSGALSNLYDRITIGAVVDFIDLYVGNWHWYTFNIADVLLVSGAFLLIVRTIRKGE